MRRRIRSAEHQGTAPALPASLPRRAAGALIRGLRRALRLSLFAGIFLYGLLLVPIARQQRHPERLGHHWSRWLARALGLRIQVHGQPATTTPQLLVGNHISWLDIVVLSAVTPALFVSKAEVARWPLVGWLTNAVKTLYIERGANGTAHVRADMLQRFAAGHRVVIFPEGTTTRGESVRRFQPRLFGAAIDGGVPVQVFALQYAQSCVAYVDGGPSMFGVLWACLAEPQIDVWLHFGPTLPAVESRDAYARAAQAWVASRIAAQQQHPAEAAALAA